MENNAQIADHLLGFSETACNHALYPHNYGELPRSNAHERITGPCGDTMEIWLYCAETMVLEASFTTDGCASSLACGSIAVELAQGLTLPEALAISQEKILEALGEFPKESAHCALLASNTLKGAIQKYITQEERKRKAMTKEEKSCKTCGDTNCGASQRKDNENEVDFLERQRLASRLCRIHHKIVVMSGKGGVGKSTLAVNLAVALVLEGKRVGLLDVDIHGPSVPTMLGISGQKIMGSEEGIIPPEVGGLKVMSIGLLTNNDDEAIIWRGPAKSGVIKQFIKDVVWGDLDYLIVDAPPGTGDEPLSLCQIIGALDGALIVTTPQKVASIDVKKSITFCQKLNVPVLGVIENMSGFVCPHCGVRTDILPAGGGAQIAKDMGVKFLCAIPIDAKIAEACDKGFAFIYHYSASPTAKIMAEIIKPILEMK